MADLTLEDLMRVVNAYIETAALEAQVEDKDPTIGAVAAVIRGMTNAFTMALLLEQPIEGILLAFLEVAHALDGKLDPNDPSAF